jgi:uncharacterized protein (TIGR02598 family)
MIPSQIARNKFLSSSGFTLVEVTISLGIVAFAMVSMVGLIPAGLSNFRSAMSNTIEAQIVQALSEDVASTDFANLPSLANQKFTFDSRGVETAADGKLAIYTASVVLQPLDDLASFPVKLKDAAARNEAYNVQILISQVGLPGQVSKYSLIVANEKGHSVP